MRTFRRLGINYIIHSHPIKLAGNKIKERGATAIVNSRIQCFHTDSEYRCITITGIDSNLISTDTTLISLLPPQICSGTFNNAISYLNSRHERERSTHHCKVLLLGHRDAGKTALMHSLFPLSAAFLDERLQGVEVDIRGSWMYVWRDGIMIELMSLIDKNTSVTQDGMFVNVRTNQGYITMFTYKDDIEPSHSNFNNAKPPNGLKNIQLHFPSEALSNLWYNQMSHCTRTTTTGTTRRSDNPDDSTVINFFDFSGNDRFVKGAYALSHVLIELTSIDPR